MVDIFDEVEEELREERMHALLKKYAGVLFAAALLVIGGVAGWKAWVWYQERRDLAAATSYLSASTMAEATGVASPNRPAAIAAFQAVAANAPDGYRILARLREASLLADSGDLQGASALWDEVAADGAADPLLRDLANLTWCIYQADKGDPALLEGRLKPLAIAGNVWRPLAQEQLALLDLREGHTEAAKTQFKKLAEDITAPAGVRNRAGILLNRAGG
ncbi:MAG: tetratricopeptide repeat protein [Acetobacteraceae bacterium]